MGERETAAERVDVWRGLGDKIDVRVSCVETETDPEADTESAGLVEADGQGDEDAEAAADSDTELGGLKEADAAAVAVRLRVVEAVIESWAVRVAVSVGFTVDV